MKAYEQELDKEYQEFVTQYFAENIDKDPKEEVKAKK